MKLLVKSLVGFETAFNRAIRKSLNNCADVPCISLVLFLNFSIKGWKTFGFKMLYVALWMPFCFFVCLVCTLFQSSACVSDLVHHCVPVFCIERLCTRNSFFEMEVLDDKVLHGPLSEEPDIL